MTLSMATRGMGFPGGRGGPGGGPGGGQQPTGPSSPVGDAAHELQTLLDNKDATPEQITAKVTALRTAKAKAKEELTKTQTESDPGRCPGLTNVAPLGLRMSRREASGRSALTETVPAPLKPGPSVAATAEACSDNMHDLSGYLLQYYFQHREFPENLADLQSAVDVGRRLSLVCPVSGKPYLYFPSSLVALDENRRLVVVDAEAVHAGGRCAIVATPPEGSQPVALWVIRLDEAMFKRYQTAPAHH